MDEEKVDAGFFGGIAFLQKVEDSQVGQTRGNEHRAVTDRFGSPEQLF